jgi:hypothetical protein
MLRVGSGSQDRQGVHWGHTGLALVWGWYEDSEGMCCTKKMKLFLSPHPVHASVIPPPPPGSQLHVASGVCPWGALLHNLCWALGGAALTALSSTPA